jgi:hypothetical protein
VGAGTGSPPPVVQKLNAWCVFQGVQWRLQALQSVILGKFLVVRHKLMSECERCSTLCIL